MFGKQSRPRYVVVYSPRSKTYAVQRVLGEGFGSRLFVAGGFPTRREANEEKKRRERGLA